MFIQKEIKEMIIKKDKKEKKSVAVVEVRSCEVNPDIDPRKHPELIGTQMLRVITNVFHNNVFNNVFIKKHPIKLHI